MDTGTCVYACPVPADGTLSAPQPDDREDVFLQSLLDTILAQRQTIEAQQHTIEQLTDLAKKAEEHVAKRLAAVLKLELPRNFDPVQAIEFDIKRLQQQEQYWAEACELAAEHCPVELGESHIRQGIPRLAEKLTQAQREVRALKDVLDAEHRNVVRLLAEREVSR
jgi:hypothetical protein